ncbi:MAG: helix-turn-helix domain-containing protein [Mangrovibacterium sp.]
MELIISTPEDIKQIVFAALREYEIRRERQEPIDKDDQLLTVDGAAELLDCTKPTIYQKTSKGELPFMKRGKKLYFLKKDLIDYLKAGRNKTNAEIAANPEEYMVKPKGRRA